MARLPSIHLSHAKVAVLGGFLVIVVVGFSFSAYRPENQSGAGDALDYAAMGRNLARGEGFTTRAIYPLQLSEDLGIASEGGFDPKKVPNLHRPPLLPLIYSFAYRVLGESSLLFPAVSFVAYLGLLLVGACCSPETPFRESARMFLGKGSRATLVAALALFPPLVRQIPAGLAEIPASVFCLAATILLIRGKLHAAKDFLVGLSIGAAFLTKSYLLLLLPAFAVYLWVENANDSRSRFRRMGLLILGWLAISVPWLVRNWIVTGNPFFALQAFCEISKSVPGYEAFRAHRGLEPLSTWAFAWNHPADLAIKSISSLSICARSDFGSNLLVGIGGFLVWRRLRTESTEGVLRRLLALYLFLTGFLAVALAPINLEPRYLLPTLIPVLVLSLFALERLWAREPSQKVILLSLAFFTVVNLAGFLRVVPAPDRTADGAFLKARVPEEGWVITDADGFVAWFADRSAVWLPSDETALDWILDRYPVRAVYLEEGLESPYLIHYEDPESALDALQRRFQRFEETPLGGLLLY